MIILTYLRCGRTGGCNSVSVHLGVGWKPLNTAHTPVYTMFSAVSATSALVASSSIDLNYAIVATDILTNAIS